MRKQFVLGTIFCFLGIIIVVGIVLQMTFMIKFEKPIFIKNIDISKTGTNYTFNFVDKYGPEKIVLLQFKKPLLSGIDLTAAKPNIMDGQIRFIVKTSGGTVLYDNIINRNNLLVEEYASEFVNLIMAKYNRTFSQYYVIVIDILEGDARYNNEPLLIITNPPPPGEVGFYYLFLLLAGSISFLIGFGIIIASIIKKVKN